MLHVSTIGARHAPKANACALHVAVSQGLVRKSDDMTIVKLGKAHVVVRTGTFVDTFDGSRRPAPPLILRAVDPETLPKGTLDEMRCRVAVIAMLEALLDDDYAVEDIRAGLAFARSYGRFVPISDDVAEVDFLCWRVLRSDLGAWFDLRFVKSRIYAA